MRIASPKGCGFSAVLVLNRVSILAILVLNWVCLLEEASFSAISTKALNSAFNIGRNWGAKYKAGPQDLLLFVGEIK